MFFCALLSWVDCKYFVTSNKFQLFCKYLVWKVSADPRSFFKRKSLYIGGFWVFIFLFSNWALHQILSHFKCTHKYRKTLICQTNIASRNLALKTLLHFRISASAQVCKNGHIMPPKVSDDLMLELYCNSMRLSTHIKRYTLAYSCLVPLLLTPTMSYMITHRPESHHQQARGLCTNYPTTAHDLNIKKSQWRILHNGRRKLFCTSMRQK